MTRKDKEGTWKETKEVVRQKEERHDAQDQNNKPKVNPMQTRRRRGKKSNKLKQLKA